MSRPLSPVRVSVIVPVFRQWEMAKTLLDALQSQLPLPDGRSEIILVNNGAPGEGDGLALPQGVRLIDCPQPGSYAARNAGAALATGELLLFTDADCRPDPQWLAAHLAAFRAGPLRLMAGPVRMEYEAPATIWARYDLVRGIPQAAYVARGYAATANLAVPAEIFRNLSGFSTRHMSGGDAEFCRRAGAAGYRIEFVAEAVVAHPCRSTAAGVIRKSRRIKGAQLPEGRAARAGWIARSVMPPVRVSLSLLRRRFSLADRLAAVLVAWILWAGDLAEALRLTFGGRPERR